MKKKVVTSARPASGFPPKIRSHPAGHMQIQRFFLKKGCALHFCSYIVLLHASMSSPIYPQKYSVKHHFFKKCR